MAIPLVAPWNGSSLYSSSEGIGSEPAELSHHQSCGCGGVERCNHDNWVGFCPDRAGFLQMIANRFRCLKNSVLKGQSGWASSRHSKRNLNEIIRFCSRIFNGSVACTSAILNGSFILSSQGRLETKNMPRRKLHGGESSCADLPFP